MKNPKTTMAALIVVATVCGSLIWTSCKKQELTSKAQEETISLKNGKSNVKHYTFDSYSESENATVRANIIDNGKGEVIINTRTLKDNTGSMGKVFSVGLPLIDGKFEIPNDGKKYWEIDLDGEIGNVRGASGSVFKCRCNSSLAIGDGSGCKVLTITPESGVVILDCDKEGDKCEGACSGLLVKNTKPGIQDPKETEDDTDNGKIIVQAGKIILNGKVFK